MFGTLLGSVIASGSLAKTAARIATASLASGGGSVANLRDGAYRSAQVVAAEITSLTSELEMSGSYAQTSSGIANTVATCDLDLDDDRSSHRNRKSVAISDFNSHVAADRGSRVLTGNR